MNRYYSDSNEELYRLMRQLGPGIGWSGKFPGSNEELLDVLKSLDEGKFGSAESPIAGGRKNSKGKEDYWSVVECSVVEWSAVECRETCNGLMLSRGLPP